VRDVTSWLPHGRDRSPTSADTGVGPQYWGDVDEVEHYQGPVSLSQLRADDELLTALGRDVELPGPDEPGPDGDELARLLADWRASIDSEPVPELVDIDFAMATLAGAKRRAEPHRRRPVLMLLAGAAAGVVVAAGALAGVARTAQPGSSLWDVSKVLYADHARSVMATDSIRQHLQRAQTAIRSGHPERARDDVASISRQLPAVNEGNGKDDLVAQRNALLDQLRVAPSNTAPTGRHARQAPPEALTPTTNATNAPTTTPKHSKTETGTDTETQPTKPSSSTAAPAGQKQPTSPPTEQQKPGTGSSPGDDQTGGAAPPPTTQSLPRPKSGSGAAGTGGSGAADAQPSTQAGTRPSTQSGTRPSTQSGTRGSSQTPSRPEPTSESGGSVNPLPSESSTQPSEGSARTSESAAQPSESSSQPSGSEVPDPRMPGLPADLFPFTFPGVPGGGTP
jgi:hypothetical protein